MDAEGLGRKLLLTPPLATPNSPEKQTVGTVTVSHKMLTLQAPSSSLNAGTGKRDCLIQGKAFGGPPAVRPPKRPRPFTHYRVWLPLQSLAVKKKLFFVQILGGEKLLKFVEKCR